MDSESAWYCIRTQPKYEHIAAAGLNKRLDLEVFLPRLRSERVTRRGRVRVVEPLFPCYLFVHSVPEGLDEIRYQTGVSRLVRFGPNIAVVPDPVIAELKQCFDSELPLPIEDPICPGAEIRVAGGALLGFSGIVVRLLPAKQRVQVLLDFLGRTTLAEVDRRELTLENCRLADLVPMLAIAPGRCVALPQQVKIPGCR